MRPVTALTPPPPPPPRPNAPARAPPPARPRDILTEWRETFVRGAAALAPVVLTIAAIGFLWNTIDGTLGPVAHAAIARALAALGRADVEIPRWAGTLAAIPLFALLCALVGGTIGAAAIAGLEDAVLRVPFARGIYRTAREVVARVSGPRRVSERLARGVVAAPFGRGGLRFVGLLPGTALAHVPRRGAPPAFPVFFSHVPTTVTGFLFLTREHEIIPLERWRLEDFARYYASGGLSMPAPAPPLPKTRAGP